MHRFVIRTKLLDLNKALSLAMTALKRSKTTWRGRKGGGSYKGSMYSAAKKALTQKIGREVEGQAEMENTCYAIFCEWYIPDYRKDPDNSTHGLKYALDGIVGAEILLNDGHKQTGGGIVHSFFKDSKDPRLELYFVKGNFNEALRALKFTINESEQKRH